MQPPMNTDEHGSDRCPSVFICGFIHAFGCGFAASCNSWPGFWSVSLVCAASVI